MRYGPLILFSVASVLSTVSASAELCGGPLDKNNFSRPLDYTSDQDKYGFGEGRRNKLALVEDNHFNADVEMLRDGINGPLPGDIHYTLMHFPNHYRALQSMSKWHLKNPHPKDEECGDCTDWLLPAECYFERAITFTPNDPTLYYIFGIYLHKKKDYQRAHVAYDDALTLGAGSAEFHYNLGLLLVDIGDYESARAHARKAYELGAPFPGLQNKLKKAGEW
jgi:tetratricopeptide (TPR) repeat protein